MFPRHCMFAQAFRASGVQTCSLTGLLCLLVCIAARCQPGDASNQNATDDLPIHGDAPNSSVCRKALAQAHTRPDKCLISRSVKGCRFDSGFFSYLEFQYCFFDSPVLPTIIMVFWLLTLLAAFAVIADSFFSPSLIALARSMHMSQNLAGVTLLAFGNGAPDVFSAITAITTGDPEAPDEGLGLGFLMGSGLLVSTVTAGLIMIIHPFRTTRRPFLKDTIFYMIAITWSAAILVRRRIYLGDSVGYMCLYLAYVIITWVSGRVHRKSPNNQFYARCSRALHYAYSQVCTGFRRIFHSCPINKQIKVQTISELETQSCWKRFSKFLFSTSPTNLLVDTEKQRGATEIDIYNTDLLKSDMPQTGGFRVSSDGRILQDDKIKMTGFKSKTKVGFPKPTVTAICPRIEITTAADEQTPKQMTRPPLRVVDRLDPNQIPNISTSISDQSLTEFSTSPRQKYSPVSESRRNSQNLSSQTTNFARKRSAVGGIGLRSRTPSMNVKRASQRINAMEQLPFVVRWIIANKEAEEQELQESSNLALDKQDDDVEKADSVPLPSSNGRCRCLSDSRDAKNRCRNINERIYDRSRSVSFVDDHSDFYPGTVSRLPRISSTSFLEMKVLDHRLDDEPTGTLRWKPRKISLSTETQFDGDNMEVDEFEVRKLTYIEWASRGMWHHLFYTIFPVNISEWPNMSLMVKILEIVQAPIFLLFRLTIPVVYEELEPAPILEGMEAELDQFPDTQSVGRLMQSRFSNSNTTMISQAGNNQAGDFTDSSQKIWEPTGKDDIPVHVLIDLENMHGWCRLLNSFQCLATPIIWVMLITVGGKCLGLVTIPHSQFPAVGIVAIISSITATVVFFATRWDRAPMPFHRPFFAILGFIASIVWIYAISHELVNSLETLGIVWEISEAILGITVMAFASSISDLLSNLLLARNGYPRIAYAACIGSPLFNILIGAGVSYTIKTSRSTDHNADLSFTLTHAILFTFLLIVLTTNIIVAVACQFKLDRIYGFVLLVVYIIFLILGVLIEADVITPPTPWNLLTGTE